MMWQSHPIQVDGVLVGAALPQDKVVRFLAVDLRAAEMDQTMWPSVDRARQAAEQLVRTGRIADFATPSIDE